MELKLHHITKLQTAIKKRFGSIVRFCKLSGIEWKELNAYFAGSIRKLSPTRNGKVKLRLNYEDPDVTKARELYYKMLCGKVYKLNGKKATIDEVSLDERLKIGNAIEAYGGITKFCADHKNFSQSAVFQLISGMHYRKTKKVLLLMEKLNLK